MVRAAPSLPANASSTAPASEPMVTPNRPIATAQPNSVPRWSRQARPSGLSSPVEARPGPGRAEIMPIPMSRRSASTKATASRMAKTPTGSASTHQRLSANGRSRVAQPIGESQDGQALVMV
ncbi:hypothetical protein [Plantactinospora veratri]